jgi:16S rRNA (adenine1518-N6/adenine1519-N6)-dimethyltransferase
LFRRHDFRPRKRLGQSFLIDGNIARKIVRLAELDGARSVVEIGAGAGAVTQFLAREAARVVAVEIDTKLVAMLRETVGDEAEIVEADMLRLDWDHVLGIGQRPWRVVANLPYSITGPALLRLLQAAEVFDRLVIMIQKEVADRLLAPPGDHARGLLTVLTEAYCDISAGGSVTPSCFYPRPRVMSKILVLKVRRPPLVPEMLRDSFMSVVKAAFSARRKTVTNALSHDKWVQLPKEETVAVLSQCGIAPKQRAEDLSAEDFLRLTRALARPSGKGVG